MKPIKREDMPDFCPKCQARLKSYHGPGGITRRICSEKCSGYDEVVIIDHKAELKGESNAILLMCSCGEVMRVDDLVDIKALVCMVCPRQGEFKHVCGDCRGTETLNDLPCHCLFE